MEIHVFTLVVIIVLLYYKHRKAKHISNHVTCFIILLLVLLVTLAYDQLNRIKNEFQSFKETQAKEFESLKQEVKSATSLSEKKQQTQEVVNRRISNKILEHEGKLTNIVYTFKQEVKSATSFSEKKQQTQEVVNRRINNKILEHEGKLTNIVYTFNQIKEEKQQLLNELLMIYNITGEINKKVDQVVDNLKEVDEARVELSNHVQSLEGEIRSLSEGLEILGKKLEHYMGEEQTAEKSDRYHHHYRTINITFSFPDLQAYVEKGFKRVMSFIASSAYEFYDTVSSFFGKLGN